MVIKKSLFDPAIFSKEINYYQKLPMNEKSILLIGNHFVSNKGNQNVWMEIPTRLSQLGWKTLTSSSIFLKPFRLLDMIWSILSKRNDYQIAQLDVFSGPSFIWADLSSRLLKFIKKPFVLTLRGGNLPDFANRHKRKVTNLLKSACKVIALSGYLKDSFENIREDITIIPNPIDVKKYPFQLRSNPQPQLVWVRAFHEIYNPSMSPKVVSYLKEDWPGINLFMIGPDKGDGSLNKTIHTAKTLGLKNEVIILGRVSREEIPGYLATGDIFINTTNHDNTPVSVMEAMACGLCIVSTNVGGIPYIVENGVDGLLVPKDDPKSMADAINRILCDSSLAERLSKNARIKAEMWDWSIVLPILDGVFTEVLTLN